MGFEVFTKKYMATVDIPTVTLSKNGEIAPNMVTVQRWLQNIEYVQLLFDAEGQRIGIKPVDKDADSIYPIRKFKNGSVKISGTAFLKHYGLLGSETKRFHAEWDEGVKAVICRLENIVK